MFLPGAKERITAQFHEDCIGGCEWEGCKDRGRAPTGDFETAANVGDGRELGSNAPYVSKSPVGVRAENKKGGRPVKTTAR